MRFYRDFFSFRPCRHAAESTFDLETMRRWEECQQQERYLQRLVWMSRFSLKRLKWFVWSFFLPNYISELLILDANRSFWNVEISLVCLQQKAQMCMKIKIVHGGFFKKLITLILSVSCSIGDSKHTISKSSRVLNWILCCFHYSSTIVLKKYIYSSMFFGKWQQSQYCGLMKGNIRQN